MDTLHHCMGNLVNSIVFGKTYEEQDQVWIWLRHLQEEGVKEIGIAGPLNFLPFLRYPFPSISFRFVCFHAYLNFQASLAQNVWIKK